MPSEPPCYCVTTSCDPARGSCDLSNRSCDPSNDACVSILIPSLTSELNSPATPTNHTPFCSGRLHHSAVYDNRSNAVFAFGGLDFSGVICAGGAIQITLDPSTSTEDEGAWLFPEGMGSGVGSGDPSVAVVGEGGPAGRYLHTANLIQVSV